MKRFLSLLNNSVMMLGNSSSGLIEAPTFGIPTVNIGDRQKGRIRGASVIDCSSEKNEIIEAMKKAVTPEFQNIAENAEKIFGDGRASEQIVEIIKETVANRKVVMPKHFYDI